MASDSVDFTTLTYAEVKSMFTNMGKPWSKDEDTKLIYEYDVKKYDILKMCNLHKRMPGGIISRLRHHKLIIETTDARGYDEWVKSKLYNEPRDSVLEKTKVIVSDNTTKDSSQKVTKKMLREQRFREIVNSELHSIKKDLKEIKTSIKELTDMLKAVYEFEDVDES
jgi:hypothetical protein